MNATFPALAPIRRSATRLRGAVAVPAAEASLPELRMLVRFLVIGILLAGSLAIYLWASTGVRETALQTDRARRHLEVARTEHERLMLQRTLLRDPGHLAQEGARLGLVAPIATVDLAPELVAR